MRSSTSAEIFFGGMTLQLIFSNSDRLNLTIRRPPNTELLSQCATKTITHGIIKCMFFLPLFQIEGKWMSFIIPVHIMLLWCLKPNEKRRFERCFNKIVTQNTHCSKQKIWFDRGFEPWNIVKAIVGWARNTNGSLWANRGKSLQTIIWFKN